ncbi:MAG: MBL fold metallo-hydrolase [Actinobacteria bacterium]|nr:MBL fold metallo-hydrolase [Actinomycetota bacterium]
MRAIDTLHLGNPHAICCWEVDGALVDPGPEVTLPTVLAALGEGFEPRAIVLTHIHLDHAAATGRLVERWPELEVYVHERGAPHLIDPSKLLASAGRLYGDEMGRLYGEFLPVPEANVRALRGGETVLGMEAAYTPGHASHHVSYLHESGTAFTGDVAGVRVPGTSLVLAPTPPPDIDLELWSDSIAILEAWDPERLAITHFGPVEEPRPHLAALREALAEEGELSARLSEEEYRVDLARRIAERAGTDEERQAIAQAAPLEYQYAGLERYWRKRAEREAA